MKKSYLIHLILLCCLAISSQLFSQKHKIFHLHDSVDLTFSGTRIDPYSQEYDTTGKVVFTGYLDTYYAHYSDTVNENGFVKFPTIAPRNNQFGLNIFQLSAKYNSNRFRSTMTIFGGDCPKSSWSEFFNFVQEANAGFRLYKKLWLDAGFFRSHIGLESIQPRENMTMSEATATYYEPYFLSGVKLTWNQSEKLAFQLNAFNAFNQFVETNKNKAIGFSLAYTPKSSITANFSTIICDESPSSLKYNRMRIYNNFCYTYKVKYLVIGLEANFGIQSNSQLIDSTKVASIFSGIVAIKYRFTPIWATYTRGEVFSDPNEILTGPVMNSNHQLVGLDVIGGTVGIEWKPIPNSYFRLESRYLHTKSDENLFFFKDRSSNQRFEFIVGFGVWF